MGNKKRDRGTVLKIVKDLMSAAGITSVESMLKIVPDNDIAMIDLDVDFDLDFDDLQVTGCEPTSTESPTAGERLAPVSGTRSVAIRVPARVLQAFRVQAAKSCIGYQTLMNRALREAAASYV
jgi:predicted DNA binding CopG/RHH family protein